MAEDVEVRFLGDVQRLTLKSDDVIVISTERSISSHVAEHIHELVALKFPGHKVLVLSDGLKIGVVGAASALAKDANPA